MASFVSTEFELLQTTIASTSFPSTLTATIEPKISSILPSSQPPLSSSFSIPPPSTIVPPSLSGTISTATTTTTTAVATTTTLNYNGLNGTDPYAFTTEARYFSLPIVIQVLMCLLYGTLAFTAVASNMIVCYIVLSNQRMRTATNYFIVNLAVGDILMALLCIPFTFPTNLIFQYWPFGLSLCVIVSYSQAISVFVSAYTMVAISIDKYMAIMYPMRLRMPKIQAKIIILVIWSAALLTSLPTALLSSLTPASPDMNQAASVSNTPNPQISSISPDLTNNNNSRAQQNYSPTQSLNSSKYTSSLSPSESSSRIYSTTESTIEDQNIEHQNQAHQEQTKHFCQESWSFWPSGQYYYSMALMVLQFVIPLFVLVITYTLIVIVVWGKRMPGEEDNARDARMARSKRKMIKMVIFCVIAFALTWLPFNALIVIGDVNPNIWEYQNIMYIWFITHYLAMCHTITNPLIYIWMNNRFRAGFRKVISDLFRPFQQVSAFLCYHCICLRFAFKCSGKKYPRVANNIQNRGPVQILTSSCSVNNTNNNINVNSNNNNSNNNNNITTSANDATNSNSNKKNNHNNFNSNGNNKNTNIVASISMSGQQATNGTKSQMASSSRPFSVSILPNAHELVGEYSHGTYLSSTGMNERETVREREREKEKGKEKEQEKGRENNLERHAYFPESKIRSTHGVLNNEMSNSNSKSYSKAVNNDKFEAAQYCKVNLNMSGCSKKMVKESNLGSSLIRITSSMANTVASDSRLFDSVNSAQVEHLKGNFQNSSGKCSAKSEQSLAGTIRNKLAFGSNYPSNVSHFHSNSHFHSRSSSPSNSSKKAKNCLDKHQVECKVDDQTSNAGAKSRADINNNTDKNNNQATRQHHEMGSESKAKCKRKRKKHSHAICIQMTSTEYGSKNTTSKIQIGYLPKSTSTATSKKKHEKAENKASGTNLVKFFGRQKSKAASVSSADVSACPACRSGTRDAVGVGTVVENVSGIGIEAASETATDNKQLFGDNKHSFLVDMRQSSQSTATISFQTNTTSLAISPLNSILTNNDSLPNSIYSTSGTQTTRDHAKFEASRSLDLGKQEKQEKQSFNNKFPNSLLQQQQQNKRLIKLESIDRHSTFPVDKLKVSSDTCLMRWQTASEEYEEEKRRQNERKQQQSLSSNFLTSQTDYTSTNRQHQHQQQACQSKTTLISGKEVDIECSCLVGEKDKCEREKSHNISPELSENSLLEAAKESYCSKHHFGSNSLTDDDVCDVFQASNSNQNLNLHHKNHEKVINNETNGDNKSLRQNQVRENGGSLELISDQFDEEEDKSLLEEYDDKYSPTTNNNNSTTNYDLEMVSLRSHQALINRSSCSTTINTQQLNVTTLGRKLPSSEDDQSCLKENNISKQTNNNSNNNNNNNDKLLLTDQELTVDGENCDSISDNKYPVSSNAINTSSSKKSFQNKTKRRTMLLDKYPISDSSKHRTCFGDSTDLDRVEPNQPSSPKKERSAIQNSTLNQKIHNQNKKNIPLEVESEREFCVYIREIGCNSSRLRNQSSSASATVAALVANSNSVSTSALSSTALVTAHKFSLSTSCEMKKPKEVVVAERSCLGGRLKRDQPGQDPHSLSLSCLQPIQSDFNQAEVNSCRVPVLDEDLNLSEIGEMELKQGVFDVCHKFASSADEQCEGTYLSPVRGESQELRLVRKSPTVYLINKTNSQENSLFEG